MKHNLFTSSFKKSSEREQEWKFLKNALCLLFVGCLALLFLNTVYQHGINEKRTIAIAHEQFLDVKHPVRKIFLGDSHVANAINPQWIMDSANFASKGEMLDQTFFKLRFALEEHPEIETIILPLDAHTFSYYRKDPYQYTWYWKRMMTYKELQEETAKKLSRLLIEANLPVIGAGTEVIDYFLYEERSEIIDGWHRRTDKLSLSTRQEENAKGRIRAQFEYYLEPDAKIIEAFDKIAFLATTKGKKLVLIQYPASPIYRESLPIDVISDLEKMKEDIMIKYPAIEIISAHELINDTSMFGDSDHLNEQGAQFFSTYIEQKLANHEK